jgi:hypothetical protein
MAPRSKPLLSVMGATEAATGLVLVVAPSLVVELLLGAAPGTAAGTIVSRIAGVAILALGVGCWLAREDEASRASRGLIAAMLLYNAGVAAILVLAWTNQGLAGIVLWPIVLAHLALVAGCGASLYARKQ